MKHTSAAGFRLLPERVALPLPARNRLVLLERLSLQSATVQEDSLDVGQRFNVAAPAWPSLIGGPIAIDHPLNVRESPDNEHVFWAN